MKFDYTTGNGANYKVTVYGWNVEDTYYFDSYDRARGFFDGLVKGNFESGTVISIRDVNSVKSNSYMKL